jgi:hypothetical protein
MNMSIESPRWVKSGKVQTEHMFSGLRRKADTRGGLVWQALLAGKPALIGAGFSFHLVLALLT